MKTTPILIPRLAITAIAAGSLCLIGSLNAQIAPTSTSDNPHLRPQTPKPGEATAKLSQKDREFIQMAANGGAAEVADGKVAQTQGQSADVKRIAAHMVSDHSRANNELVELAKKKGLGIDISKGKPRNFDKARFDGQYLASMESDHVSDIKLFEKEANSGDDADLKAWAAKTLPTLKSHLSMVKDAKKKIK